MKSTTKVKLQRRKVIFDMVICQQYCSSVRVNIRENGKLYYKCGNHNQNVQFLL